MSRRITPWTRMIADHLRKNGQQSIDKLASVFAYAVPADVAARWASAHDLRATSLSMLVVKGRVAYVKNMVKHLARVGKLVVDDEGMYCLPEQRLVTVSH